MIPPSALQSVPLANLSTEQLVVLVYPSAFPKVCSTGPDWFSRLGFLLYQLELFLLSTCLALFLRPAAPILTPGILCTFSHVAVCCLFAAV